MGLILLNAHIYKLEKGIYPETFQTIIKEGEIPDLKIKKTGREIMFRGYRICLIEKREDGSLYSSPENRKNYFGLYGIPILYGISGQNKYIVNEQGKMYSMDFGDAKPIEQWIKSPIDEGWEYAF